MIRFSHYSAHPEDIRWGLKASAIIDTLLCSNPLIRYHTFLENRFPGVDVGILDHGSGDRMYCILDATNGSLIKGFDHQSSMSPHAQQTFQTWPGIFEESPAELLGYLEAPEFDKIETTFCIWRKKQDQCWWQGEFEESEEGEGSSALLDQIFLDAQSYYDWAKEYYQSQQIAIEPIVSIYDSCQLNHEQVTSINPNVDLNMVQSELAKMGVTISSV